MGWLEGPRLSDLQHTGPLPPGALGYACAKAATICRAGIDVEFHQLAGAIHLFGDGVAWLAREARKRSVEPPPLPLRGVWGADGIFYPLGVALCDWWRSLTARGQRRWLHSAAARCSWARTGCTSTLARRPRRAAAGGGGGRRRRRRR